MIDPVKEREALNIDLGGGLIGFERYLLRLIELKFGLAPSNQMGPSGSSTGRG